MSWRVELKSQYSGQNVNHSKSRRAAMVMSSAAHPIRRYYKTKVHNKKTDVDIKLLKSS